MTPLPTGTVTFFFSDIEGSTKLLQRLNKEFFTVLDQHSTLMRKVFEAHDGVVVSTEGDSFFVVFSSAIQGVEAAVSAQRALLEHPWQERVSVRVRMGLHSGEGMLASNAMDVTGVLFHIDNMAQAAKARGNIERAIRLSSVASVLRSSSGTNLVELSRELYGFQPVGEEGLSQERFQELWAESEKWSLEEAIAYAMERAHVS